MKVLHRQPMHRLCFLVTVGLGLLVQPCGTAQTNAVSYKHAYYLFLEGGGKSCEECYVPLLITQNSLDQIAARSTSEEGLLIITYERDSIWQGKGTISLDAKDIQAGERIIRLDIKKYRYQEISAAEALRLFENPKGMLPISRPAGTGMPAAGLSLADLIQAFKNAS